MDEFKQDIKEIKEDLREVVKLQATHNQQLKEHLRRSEAAEENLKLLRAEFEPVKSHTILAATLAKVGAVLATLAATYWKLFH